MAGGSIDEELYVACSQARDNESVENFYKTNAAVVHTDDRLFRIFTTSCFYTGSASVLNAAVCARSNFDNGLCRFEFSSRNDMFDYACRWSIQNHISNFRFRKCTDDNQAHINIDRLFACSRLWKKVAMDEKEMPELLWSLGDAAHGPGLAFCHNADDVLLVPDSYFLGLGAYAELRDYNKKHSIPWVEREPTLFWRGSATGLLDSKGRLPREELCRLTNGRDDCNIGLNEHWGKCDDAFSRPYVHWSQFGRYRYHIDLDGSTNSWPGLFSKLLAGGVVLKIDSPLKYRQWYYDFLQPWVNYIPVKSDFSDLFDAFEKVKRNDDLGQRIGSAGQALAFSLDMNGEVEKSSLAIRSFAYKENGLL